MKNQEDDLFNLKETEANKYLQTKAKTEDGLLRPSLNDAVDGKRELVLRILPNLTKEGKIKSTVLEKHIHYADFKQNPELQGYFDCLKNTNIGKDCPLCKTYWALTNTKNPKDEEKAKLISRSTKSYAYAYVVEDKQVPDNEGKIFIFPFGFKILQKIKAQANNTRKPVTVEDLVFGANLVLIIEEIGGYYNYDASYFEGSEPISIGGKQIKVGADGTIDSAQKAKVIEFLKSRTHELEDFTAKDWTSEQHDKAGKIISLLSGQSYTASTESTPKVDTKKPLTSAQIFSADDEDDETPIPVRTKSTQVTDDEDTPKPKARVKPIVEEDDEPKQTAKSDLDKAKNKAKAFFEDDED